MTSKKKKKKRDVTVHPNVVYFLSLSLCLSLRADTTTMKKRSMYTGACYAVAG